jgi:hypothetical protein
MSEENKFSILKNRLIISENEIVFDFPIDYCTEIDSMLIVLLSIPIDKQYNENVFGISLIEKKIKWRVDKLKYNPVYKQQCPFVSVIVNNGKVRLNNWCGTYLIVNPLTGDILEKGETR